MASQFAQPCEPDLPWVMQAQISSCIRCDADCIGIAALLPLSVFNDSVPLKQLTAYWRKHAKGSESEGKLGAALEGKDVAVLVSERVVNAPAELATPLVAGIVRDQQQCFASGDCDLLPHGNVKHVIHCALAYIDSGTAPNELGAVPVTAGSSSKPEVCIPDLTTSAKQYINRVQAVPYLLPGVHGHGVIVPLLDCDPLSTDSISALRARRAPRLWQVHAQSYRTMVHDTCYARPFIV